MTRVPGEALQPMSLFLAEQVDLGRQLGVTYRRYICAFRTHMTGNPHLRSKLDPSARRSTGCSYALQSLSAVVEVVNSNLAFGRPRTASTCCMQLDYIGLELQHQLRQHLSSVSRDGVLSLWHMPTKNLDHIFTDQAPWRGSVIFSPNGNYIASMSARKQSALLRDITTGLVYHTIFGGSRDRNRISSFISSPASGALP